jgi:predicted RNA-binding protein with PIN domain
MLRGHDYLLVDGYNVSQYWLNAGFLQPGELEYVRQQMITVLSSIAGYWEVQCLLVFDAHLVKDNLGSSEQITPHLCVIFTPENQTADSVIERLAFSLATTKKQVLVCTSDRAEQNLVLTQGASRISSREFLQEVKRAKREMNSNYSRHPTTIQRSWLEDNLPDDVKEALDNMRKKK